MQKTIYFLLIVFISIGMNSCKRTKSVVSLDTKSRKWEDFDTFYTKFHSDSTFQVSRVKFPLGGHNKNAGNTHINWSKDNWIMHRSKINEVDRSVYKVEVIKKDGIQKERIFIDGGEFDLQREFKLINGKWYLTQFINKEY